MTTYGPDGKIIKPSHWRYINGKWDKRVGLVIADVDMINMAEQGKSQGVRHHRSHWFGRAWHRYYWLSSFRLEDFWKSLNMDQRLMIWANITSAILSVIAIAISIVALVRS